MEAWLPDSPDIFDVGLFMSEGKEGVQGPILRGSFNGNDVILLNYILGGSSTHDPVRDQTVTCFKLHKNTIPG